MAGVRREEEKKKTQVQKQSSTFLIYCLSEYTSLVQGFYVYGICFLQALFNRRQPWECNMAFNNHWP